MMGHDGVILEEGRPLEERMRGGFLPTADSLGLLRNTA